MNENRDMGLIMNEMGGNMNEIKKWLTQRGDCRILAL